MALASLTASSWTDTTKSDEIIANPSWEAVEAAIRALDNRRLNDLYLTPDDNSPESFLCVGGGGGRYLVAGAIDNQKFPTLTRPGNIADETVALTVGGQEGKYPANWIVDLDLALRAARHYWETARFDPGLVWTDA